MNTGFKIDNGCLCVDLVFLVDAMQPHDARDLIDTALGQERLIEMVVRQVGGYDAPANRPNPPDLLLSNDLIRRIRVALAPMLGEAVASELNKAVDEAASMREKADALAEIVNIHCFIEEEREFADHWKRAMERGRRAMSR